LRHSSDIYLNQKKSSNCGTDAGPAAMPDNRPRDEMRPLPAKQKAKSRRTRGGLL